MSDRFCDCGTSDLVHEPNCLRHGLDFVNDNAFQAAAEDGYPLSRAAIRHPSHAATRAHFRRHPLPGQRKRVA